MELLHKTGVQVLSPGSSAWYGCLSLLALNQGDTGSKQPACCRPEVVVPAPYLQPASCHIPVDISTFVLWKHCSHELLCSPQPFQVCWSCFCSWHKVTTLSFGHGKTSWGKETQVWGFCGWYTTILPWRSIPKQCGCNLRHPNGLCLHFACSTGRDRAAFGLSLPWGKWVSPLGLQ